MKSTPFYLLISTIVLILAGCSKDLPTIQSGFQQDLNAQLDQTQLAMSNGAIQISGIGYFAEESQCQDSEESADFALNLTGDLEGCLYVYVENYNCSPSGTYREDGREHFVGTYNGESGSFWTTYKFEAKYEGCSDDGFFLGAEIFGRCQHPFVDGSGTGVFEGVSGRINFKDNVVTGELPYKGHLSL